MASLWRPVAPAALVAVLAVILAGCYTQVRTGPREPPPPAVLYPAPTPPSEPPSAAPPLAEPVVEPIDGDYSGYSLTIDATGHHMGRIEFAFHDGIYRYEGDDLKAGAGAYTLGQGEIILQAGDSLKTGADSSLVLQGPFELHRNDDGIQLLRRDEVHGHYLELGLRRENDPPAAVEEDKI